MNFAEEVSLFSRLYGNQNLDSNKTLWKVEITFKMYNDVSYVFRHETLYIHYVFTAFK